MRLVLDAGTTHGGAVLGLGNIMFAVEPARMDNLSKARG